MGSGRDVDQGSGRGDMPALPPKGLEDQRFRATTHLPKLRLEHRTMTAALNQEQL